MNPNSSFTRSSTTTATAAATTTPSSGVKDQQQQRQQSPTQWVEIIEPKSKEKMYANLLTGNCVWDPPEVRSNAKLKEEEFMNQSIVDIKYV